MKRIGLCLLLLGTAIFADAAVTVKSVEAQQRYPWNGLVDIVVSLECSADEINAVECSFVATNSVTRVAVPVTSILQKGSDVGSGTTWVRRFIWNATNDVGAVKIDDLSLTVDAKMIGIQLWENGPYWAECNVGASKPEGYGYYFWWGGTVGYKRNANDDDWISVKGGTSFSFDDCPTFNRDMPTLLSLGYIDKTGNLVAEHDAATAHLGAPWRMPTDAEMGALIGNCDTTWTTCGGVYGRRVTGRGAYSSKSIFLPAAGYGEYSSLCYPGSYGAFWSSTPYSDVSGVAWGLYFDSGGFRRGINNLLYCGKSVRPVRGFAK